MESPLSTVKFAVQESRAVAGKSRNAAVIFQDGGWLLSWIQSNWK